MFRSSPSFPPLGFECGPCSLTKVGCLRVCLRQVAHGPRHTGFCETEGRRRWGRQTPGGSPVLPPGVHSLHHPLSWSCGGGGEVLAPVECGEAGATSLPQQLRLAGSLQTLSLPVGDLSDHVSSAVMNRTNIHEDGGSILGLHQASRHCHELWCKSLMWLGFCVAVAVV